VTAPQRVSHIFIIDIPAFLHLTLLFSITFRLSLNSKKTKWLIINNIPAPFGKINHACGASSGVSGTQRRGIRLGGNKPAGSLHGRRSTETLRMALLSLTQRRTLVKSGRLLD
jgi:hypothetical protein